MRIPGFAGEVMAKLGVKPINIPPGELYTSLESGLIDALEWVGPGMDITMGFHKIAPYYYTGWHEPSSEMQFMINTKKMDSLPKHLQAILKIAMRSTAYNIYIETYHLNSIKWLQMKREYPAIQVRTFPKVVMEVMRRTNDEVIADLSAKHPFLKRVFRSQKSYQEKARAWSIISDFNYLKAINY